jgi:hypothetical protein
MARIFISYSRNDADFAHQLAERLSNLGANIWIDVEHIPPGMKWSTAIQQGLRDCEVMLLIVSPDSMDSGNVEDEWQYFLDKHKLIIPLLLRDTEPHFQLSRLQHLDFTQNHETAFEYLYEALQNNNIRLSSTSPDIDVAHKTPPLPDDESTLADPSEDLPTYTPQPQAPAMHKEEEQSASHPVETPGPEPTSDPGNGKGSGLLLLVVIVVIVVVGVLVLLSGALGGNDGGASPTRTSGNSIQAIRETQTAVMHLTGTATVQVANRPTDTLAPDAGTTIGASASAPTEQSETSTPDVAATIEANLTASAVANTAVVQITSPENGELVPQFIMVEGTHELQEADKDRLWLFLIGPNGVIYPQANEACAENGTSPVEFNLFQDTWRVQNVQIGDSRDTGAQFDLFVTLLDDTQLAIMQNYFDVACIGGNFSGISQGQLGVGSLNVLHQITVTRQ